MMRSWTLGLLLALPCLATTPPQGATPPVPASQAEIEARHQRELVEARLQGQDKAIEAERQRVQDLQSHVASGLGGLGLLIAIVAITTGVATYFSAKRKAREEAELSARNASEHWFQKHETDLNDRIEEQTNRTNRITERIEEFENTFSQFTIQIEAFNPQKQMKILKNHFEHTMRALRLAQLLQAKVRWNSPESLDLLQLALEDFRHAEADTSDRPMVLGNQGYALFLLGQHNEAEAALRRALQEGGERLFKAEMEDADHHPVPPDADFKALVQRLWDEIRPASA